MSATELETFLSQPYSYAHFRDFITQSFGHHIHIKSEASYNYHEGSIIKSYTQVCEPIALDTQSHLGVYAFKTRSINAKVGLHKEIASILKDSSNLDALLAVFYEEDSQEFRLSLVSRGYDYEANRQTFSNPRRQSFVLGHEKIKTAKTQLQDFIDKEQKSLESLQEAFDTEPLSKEFYEKYEGLFSTLSDKLIKHQAAFTILQSYEGLSEEGAVRAFVKKLLGRIVFLYFLQKKGWLGVKANAPYGSGDKEFLYSLFCKAKANNQSFYKDYLCPLFFDSLNTKRENDYFAPFDCKIPFLNGGLFEEAKRKDSKGDEIGIDTHFIICEILSNSDFEEVFDVFESYNFTIEESIPNDEEIGIDPEMLGKIFENLIDCNKSSGAFYTPKSIVHFMCKNALMRTLQEKFCHNEEEKDSIYALIFALESDNPFIAQNRQAIIDTLKNLTILDPAIGSGAFPMGLLSEILQILCNLDPMLNRAQIAALKREIIQKSIYGIDIDADAIEVAKLRFWLSIAVDEEAPTPLPNLDFNFMQGNSLLERIENIEIMPSSFHSKDTQRDLWGKRDSDTSLFDKSQADKLITLFSAFFEENDATKKHSLKREILNIIESAFNERIAQIESEIQSERDNPKVKPRERAAQQDKILSQENFIKELRELLNDYKTKDFHTDKLFLYHFFFARVFKNGGFDICIGNPPYITKKKTEYPQYKWNTDTYMMFFEKGFTLTKQNGYLSFITPKFWLVNANCEDMRKYFLESLHMISLSETNPFEMAVTENIITEFQVCKPKINTIIHYKCINNIFNFIDIICKNTFKNNLKNEIILNINKDMILFFDKICSNTICLESISESKRGAEYGKKFCRQFLSGKKVLLGYDLSPYCIQWDNTYIDKDLKDIQRLQSFFDADKMIYLRRVDSRLSASVSFEKFAFIKNIYGIRIVDENYSHLFVLALINSKLLNFYYLNKFTTKKEQVFPEIQTYLYEKIPIPKITKQNQKIVDFIIALVEEILNLKAKDPTTDTSKLESEIDNLVYELYNLSDEDIRIVENKGESYD